jgi:hypothetical protein
MPISAYKQELFGHLAIAIDEMSENFIEDIRREHPDGRYGRFLDFNETLYRFEFDLGCRRGGLQ